MNSQALGEIYRYPPINTMVRFGCTNPGSFDVMPFLFFINHGLDKGLQIFVRSAVAQIRPQIVIVLAEKARPQFSVRVSRMREQWPQNGCVTAQSAQSLPARHPQNDTFGRLAFLMRNLHKRPPRIDPLEYFRRCHHLLA